MDRQRSGQFERRLGSHRPIRSTVREIVQLERRGRITMSRGDRLADRITGISGSMLFVYLHVVWFGVWIALNVGIVVAAPFDPFPYGLLTMIVSLEAIFLSTFVLITQNREATLADRRARIDLELDVIAEQEVTKILRVLDLISAHLGVDLSADPDLKGMEESIDLTRLMDEIEEAEQVAGRGRAVAPDGPIDSEA